MADHNQLDRPPLWRINQGTEAMKLPYP